MHVLSYIVGASFFVLSVVLVICGGIAAAMAKPQPVIEDDELEDVVLCECDACLTYGDHAPFTYYVGAHRNDNEADRPDFYYGKHQR